MDGTLARPAATTFPIGFKEFVALIASLMALNALAIDAMLPALPAMGDALDIVHENDRQWIIAAYVLGLGAAQLFWGPLADRFGRRRVLLAGVASYVLFSVAAALAGSFAMMIAARVMQGTSAAATRVLAVSIVRDRFAGRAMAKVMSLTFIVFLAVPMLAPTLGQAILLFAPWRWIFGLLALSGLAVLIWVFIRLPETLHPEHRLEISLQRWKVAWLTVVSERMSVGYSLALMLLFGSLMGFINSSQQIFFDVFGLPQMFPLIFAALVSMMAVTSLLNARFVEEVGTRRISHAGLIGFTAFAAVHAGVAIAGLETIWTFAVLQSLMMACFGLSSSNFGAMAMEHMGSLAGTAASVQGAVVTIGGALLGLLIGQQFDGTTTPITLGFTLLGASALVIVLITEKGRLFRPQNIRA